MQLLPGLDTSILQNSPLQRAGFKFTFKLKILLDFPQGIYYSIMVSYPSDILFFGFIIIIVVLFESVDDI